MFPWKREKYKFQNFQNSKQHHSSICLLCVPSFVIKYEMVFEFCPGQPTHPQINKNGTSFHGNEKNKIFKIFKIANSTTPVYACYVYQVLS